jgi:hypothetical protein
MRVEIQPGPCAGCHTHEDVTFHLLMPLTGPLQVTAGPATVMARVGQAYFMKKACPTPSRITGATAVIVMETFVKPEPRPAAGGSAPGTEAALAMALAASRGFPASRGAGPPVPSSPWPKSRRAAAVVALGEKAGQTLLLWTRKGV